MGSFDRRYESLTHLLDAYVAMIMQAENVPQSMKDQVASHQAEVVLAPVEVAPVVKPPLVTQYATTMIPRPVFMPTAPFVGDDSGGGINVPFSAGPVSIATMPPVIGTMLIMIAGRVAVSIAVRGANDLYGGLKKQYHRRDALLRVFTGVGRKAMGRKKTDLRDGYDPSLPDGSDRVRPRMLRDAERRILDGTYGGNAHPGEYDLDNWDDVPIVGGPAFGTWLPQAHEWINTYGPEFGSWM